LVGTKGHNARATRRQDDYRLPVPERVLSNIRISFLMQLTPLMGRLCYMNLSLSMF